MEFFMKMAFNVILTVVAICIFLPAIARANDELIDCVYLKDGKVLKGTIVENIPNKHIIFQHSDGKIETIEFGKIEKTTKEKNTEYYSVDRHYTEFGVTLGTPGGLNAVIGRWFGPFGLKLSGMYLGSLYGAQLEFSAKLSENKVRTHAITGMLGTLHLDTKNDFNLTEHKNWDYFGLAYTLNVSGFYLQAGLSVGNGSFTSPQILFQIGYVHRFW